MRNKQLLLLSLLLIASMILSACGGSEAPAGEAPEPQATQASNNNSGGGSGSSGGGAPAGGSPTFDPANASDDKVLAAAAYVYEGLVSMKDGEVVGALAESFTMSDDGLEYTFFLRPGVTFHDGAALNADLVVLNFNRWFDTADVNRGTGSYTAWLNGFNGFKGETKEDGKPKSQYDGIEKVNDLTVLIHLNEPDADFLTKMSTPAFVISSPAGFSGGDGGSGPYKVGGGDSAMLKLEPFAGYWNTAAIPTSAMEVPLK